MIDVLKILCYSSPMKQLKYKRQIIHVVNTLHLIL